MKLLCEVPLNEVQSFERSQFSWLAKSNNSDNFLFTLENDKRLRVFAIKQQQQAGQNAPGPPTTGASEAQSASLAEPRKCTSLAWNRDQSLLALVVDRRQIFFWEVRRNSFVQFKPKHMMQQQQQQQQQQASSSNSRQSSSDNTADGAGGGGGVPSGLSSSSRRRTFGKDIEHIAWSRLTDKLAICFASGQILLCNIDVSVEQQSFYSIWERFIGNSDSVLRKIDSIQVSEHADLFACTSVSGELLVMTFDGDNRLYCQNEGGEGCRLAKMRFSPMIREYNPRLGRYCEHHLWLAYQLDCSGSLYLRKILAGGQHSAAFMASASDSYHGAVMAPKLAVQLVEPPPTGGGSESMAGESARNDPPKLIEFHWLSSTRLLACLSSGSIQLIQINNVPPATATSLDPQRVALTQATSSLMAIRVLRSEVLRIQSSDLPHDSDELDAAMSPSSPSPSSPNAFSQPQPQNQHDDDDDDHVSAFKSFELTASKRRSGETNRLSFVLAAATSHRLFYYEIYENEPGQASGPLDQFTFEQFDDVDLSEALLRVNLKLQRFKWAQDCSMLAVQLSSGHLLVYQTQLQHSPMVASYAAKTAYLSAPSEITLLNYGLDELAQPQSTTTTSGDSPLVQDDNSVLDSAASGRHSTTGSTSTATTTRLSNNAIILNVQFKPSLLAIGPHHLAVALNNRVRFYSIETIQRLNNHQQQQQPSGTVPTGGNQSTVAAATGRKEFDEQEYVTLVLGIGLSSRYIAVLLDDGRLKLHSINQLCQETVASADRDTQSYTSENQDNQDDDRDDDDDDDEPTEGLANDERFFPEPSESQQRISAFALTEELLVYCTRERLIQVFGIRSWLIVQICDHTSVSPRPVFKLKPNERGNKFICQLELANGSSKTPTPHSTSDGDDDVEEEANVFLYDLFTNRALALIGGPNQFVNQLLHRQLERTFAELPLEPARLSDIRANSLATHRMQHAAASGSPSLSRTWDVVWDTDGRTILFIKPKSIHVFAILDHTLGQAGPVAVYADSARKPSSYSTLYVSQGIVSYQTSLGRVINAILETHDDELKLTRLEQQIKSLIEADEHANQLERLSGGEGGDGENSKAINQSLECQLKIMLLKLNYLRSILPIYSLPKCRDICEHLMEDGALNYSSAGCQEPWRALIDNLIWRQLAAWSIFTLNLTFAQQLYKKYNLSEEFRQLGDLFEDMRARGLDSRAQVNERLHKLLLA